MCLMNNATNAVAAERVLLAGLIILLQLISISAAAAVCEAAGDIAKIGGKTVFELNWSNWRIWIAIGLAISFVLVAIIRFIASFLKDEGLLARSRTEVFQLAATAVIALFFIAFFQFLCSPILPSIFGFTGNMFDKTESYLSNMVSWTRGSFYQMFFLISLQNWYESASEKSAGQNPLTWGFAGGLANLFPKALITTFLFAYMSANLHLQLLQFLQPYTLMFLIPAGIALRSFFPFRRFGGALLGAGIALIVIFPLLMLLNALLVGAYFDQPGLLNISCTENRECLSKVCDPATHLCSTSLSTDAACDPSFGDWQCSSSRCINSKCADPAALGDIGAACTNDKDCRAPFWCDNLAFASPRCAKPLELDGVCVRDYMCGIAGSAFCNDTHACRKTKDVGMPCRRDEECGSLNCIGVAPNKKCGAAKYDQRQVVIEIGKAGIAGGSIASKISLFDTIFKPIESLTIALVGGVFLPLLNYLLLSRAVKDFSAFFGAELDIASIYRVL